MRILWMALLLLAGQSDSVLAGTKTWDGRYDTSRIDLTVVYFVPSDRQPLVDWRDRATYFCNRLEQFHRREFGTQSELVANLIDAPMQSELTTTELRKGDADAIFFRTLREVDRRLDFGQADDGGFPILLVLSEINWRPLDDFYRVRPEGDSFAFEGNFSKSQHFPGAESGGARASYLADRGVGWGLVSADGWRVPYRGSDCVVYHEGCGHTVGLPHPDDENGSVMSLGQYRGWISESWLDKDQKARMGWEPEAREQNLQTRLFSSFRAIPEPAIPQPGETVRLRLDWPDDRTLSLKSIRLRYQTSLSSPWVAVPVSLGNNVSDTIELGAFDRETPVSYRIDVALTTGETAELWGYFQVRESPDKFLIPPMQSSDLLPTHHGDSLSKETGFVEQETDLLSLVDLTESWKTGEWTQSDGRLLSPPGYGRRLQLPYHPPDEYRLTAIVEPLDAPNGLLFGHAIGGTRFVTLFSYTPHENALSAIENINGRNVGNESTHTGALFQKGQLSQVIVDVRKNKVTMRVDGRTVVDWTGSIDQLSLSDYWQTPDQQSLFIGTYDCRYRFYRLSLQPLSASP